MGFLPLSSSKIDFNVLFAAKEFPCSFTWPQKAENLQEAPASHFFPETPSSGPRSSEVHGGPLLDPSCLSELVSPTENTEGAAPTEKTPSRIVQRLKSIRWPKPADRILDGLVDEIVDAYVLMEENTEMVAESSHPLGQHGPFTPKTPLDVFGGKDRGESLEVKGGKVNGRSVPRADFWSGSVTLSRVSSLFKKSEEKLNRESRRWNHGWRDPKIFYGDGSNDDQSQTGGQSQCEANKVISSADVNYPRYPHTEKVKWDDYQFSGEKSQNCQDENQCGGPESPTRRADLKQGFRHIRSSLKLAPLSSMFSHSISQKDLDKRIEAGVLKPRKSYRDLSRFESDEITYSSTHGGTWGAVANVGCDSHRRFPKLRKAGHLPRVFSPKKHQQPVP